MKFVDRRPFTDPDAAALKLVEIANGVEAVQDGRIYIERVNAPFLAAGDSGEDFRAGIVRAVAQGWLWRRESGTYVKFTDNGAALVA
jgi:ribosomal protein L14